MPLKHRLLFFIVSCMSAIMSVGVERLYGQQQSYSAVGSEFAAQIEQQFSKVTLREELAQTVKDFALNVSSGRIADTKLQDIVAQCNLMQSKKMRPTPHFTAYFTAINGFIKSGYYDKKFDSWHAIVKDLTAQSKDGKFSNIEKFLAFSDDFFNQGAIYASTGKKWVVQTTDYSFMYDNSVPRLVFPEATLHCYAAKDTVAIQKSKGEFFPFENKWTATSGRVTWSRVGLDPNMVYADLSNYTLDLTKDDYKIEDATFYHKKLFSQALKGRVMDKISGKIEGEYIYPQFESYDLALKLKDYAPQTEFRSGFAMRGRDFTSYGTEAQRALLLFFSKDGKQIMKARSTSFRIREGKEVISNNASAAIYFGQDSIYHPRLNMFYDINSREVRLTRDNKASGKIAFMSSYHKLEANVDGLWWKINTPVIDFKMVSELKNLRVVFESFDMYDKGRYNSYRTFTDHDPLGKLYDYYRNNQTEVPADDFAKYINGSFTSESILNLLLTLVADGFIYYNPDTDMITVRDKVGVYEEARRKTRDFDRIALISESTQENAQLDLEEKELLVTGLKDIGLSDSQRVIIYPKGGITRVKKNRDMDVDGTIVAGNVDFIGKNFKFHYDDFDVKMDTVDQMLLYVDTRNKRFEKITPVDGVLAPINTPIFNARGTLFIDKSDNKSGREKYPSYPRFESSGNAYLYYNSKKLYNGAYKKDTFYFKLNPFNFDDLDEIQPENVVFPGTMITGDIFPPFEQTTSLQEDLSLGFVKNTPAQGMPTYKKGNFTGTLSMSNKGLIGEGKVDYMAGAVLSKEFIFLPDSMLTEADSFYQERKTVRGVEFPSAHNSNVKIKWMASKDSMLVYMKKRPFMMFEDKVNLKGNLLVTDKGLKGSGTMNWSEASIRSKEFFYTSGTFKSDSADVAIKNKDAAKVAFDSYNVRARVDMDKYLGEFLANGANIPINLPYNQYKTTASEFYWLMNDKLINIRMPDDTLTSYFTSTHPDQGGLKFRASGGVVNLAENTIKVDGIPYITVADAKIRPADTQIFIDPDAKIRTLENALIVADSTNEYHKITDATIKINNINSFEGSGDYKYRGKNMKKQEVRFDHIGTKEDETRPGKYFTTASTDIKEEKGFKLNNKIAFKGDVVLDSRKKFLVFDGFAKLDLLTKAIDLQWFRFTDQIDPENIQIDVSVPIGEHKDTLSFGVLQNMDALVLYPTFLTKKQTPIDRFVFRASGELASDAETNVYRVGMADRLDGKVDQGNIYTLKDSEGKVQADGRFTFGESWGSMVEVAAAGSMTHDTKTTNFDFKDIVVGLNFNFDKKLLTSIGETLRSYNGEGTEINYTKEGFYKSASQLVEKGYVGDLKGTLNRQGYFGSRMKGLDQGIILTDIAMIYDSSLATFHSVGKLGVSFIGDQYVNRMAEGFLEFGIRQTGDFFNLYLETNKDDLGKRQWFFITYKKGKLEVLSSDMVFNQAVADMPEKKRLSENKKTGENYIYTLAPMLKRNQFVAIMRGGDIGMETIPGMGAPDQNAPDTNPADPNNPQAPVTPSEEPKKEGDN